MLFSPHFYSFRGKKMIDCLQKKKVLIAALWDDESSVWSPSLGHFSNPFTLQKHSDVRGDRGEEEEKKKLLPSSDYRLLQPDEQTFVLSTPPFPSGSWRLWSRLKSSTNCPPPPPPPTSDGPSNVRKAALRASCGPPGLKHAHFFYAPSGLRKKPTEEDLCVSSPACHKTPGDWLERGEGRADAAASETLRSHLDSR